MPVVSAFINLESKRFFCKRNRIIFLLFLAFSLYFVQIGINRYKSLQQSIETFRQSERMKVQQFVTYDQYGTFGFRLLFFPSPLSTLFYNSSAIPSLSSFVDSGVRLHIHNSFLGKNLFEENSVGFRDFSGIIFLLGSLFALFLGYEAMYNKEYLKFLSSLLNYKCVYIAILISRLLFILFFFLFTVGCNMLLLLLNSLRLTLREWGHLGIFVISMVLMLFFFFVAGTAVGNIKSRSSGIFIIFFIWFGFVFAIPDGVRTFVSQKSNQISSNYKIEQDKLKILMGFEKRAIQEAGKYKRSKRNTKPVRRMIENYWNGEFKRIRALNDKMKEEMRGNINRFHSVSRLFPSSFYLAVNNEVSSKGYESFLNFYAYNQKIKVAFVRYFFDKKFYSQIPGVESFIKNRENIFFAGSHIPPGFATGVTISILYIVVLLALSSWMYRNSLFHVTCKDNEDSSESIIQPTEIRFSKGEYSFVRVFDKKIFNRFYNFLSGKDHPAMGKVTFDRRYLNTSGKVDFLYLCSPGQIPGELHARDLFSFFYAVGSAGAWHSTSPVFSKNGRIASLPDKPFDNLEHHQKGDVLLTIAELHAVQNRLILLDNFESDMPPEFNRYMSQVIEQLKVGGAAIVHFSKDAFFTPENADRYATITKENGSYIYRELSA